MIWTQNSDHNPERVMRDLMTKKMCKMNNRICRANRKARGQIGKLGILQKQEVMGYLVDQKASFL